ncbi:sensor histidine kinase [Facklamia sp. P12945]|uniref:sensor histidine kinase n=1 Tax=Facklamia sp. P12945 TaxID=3421950 RepID=UPI003D16DE66
MDLLNQISLYELCYSAIFIFSIIIHYKKVNWYEWLAVYFFMATLAINPLYITRWQIAITYFVVIILSHTYFSQSFDKTILFSSLSYINLALIDQYYRILTSFIDIESLSFYFVFSCTSILLIWLLTRIEAYLFMRLIERFPQLVHKGLVFLSILSLGILLPALIQAVQEFTGDSKGITQFVLAINLTIFLLFISGAIFLYFALEKMKEAQRQIAQQKINQEYSSMITQQYTEMRKFRHDYKNVLLSIEGLIREKAWDALSSYFFQELAPDSETNQIESNALNPLVYLNNPELRMIFYSKLSYAIANGLKVHLEISENLPRLEEDLMAISRMLGIILDNAIEASLQQDQAQIDVLITQLDQEYLIMVANPTQASAQELIKMRQMGFSTKGENRGFGLSNLQELAKDADISLFTSIENNQFVQELYIPLARKVDNP